MATSQRVDRVRQASGPAGAATIERPKTEGCDFNGRAASMACESQAAGAARRLPRQRRVREPRSASRDQLRPRGEHLLVELPVEVLLVPRRER